MDSRFAQNLIGIDIFRFWDPWFLTILLHRKLSQLPFCDVYTNSACWISCNFKTSTRRIVECKNYTNYNQVTLRDVGTWYLSSLSKDSWLLFSIIWRNKERRKLQTFCTKFPFRLYFMLLISSWHKFCCCSNKSKLVLRRRRRDGWNKLNISV